MAPGNPDENTETVDSGEMLVSFGDSLRILRDQLGLNQKEFADICGVRRQTAGNWEKGNTAPDIKHLYLLRKWCFENNKSIDLGELLGEKRTDWRDTPLGYPINLLQDIDRLGIRGVYRNRADALAAFDPFIRNARSISITSSSLLGIRVVAPEQVSTALREKAGEVPFRILMTDPGFSALREKQEGRRPGSIKIEIEESVDRLLDWGVPKENIRFFRGAPTVFMILTPDRAVVNPYTYSTEAYHTFAFECAPTTDRNVRDVYRQYRDSHFERPWTKGKSVEEVLEDEDDKK